MIQIKDIVVEFDEKRILNKLNMTIEKGRLVMLIGDNGCGKSTLLKTIAGRVLPREGHIKVKHSFTFHQQKFPLLENMTVEENIKVFSGALEFDVKKEELDKLLKSLDLIDFRKVCVDKLSGGQQQRLSLIITLLRNKDIYIIDEADAAMDPKGRNLYHNELKELRDNGKTILLVSHHVKEVLKFADDCFLIKDGKASYINPQNISDELYKYSNHEFIKSLENMGGLI